MDKKDAGRGTGRDEDAAETAKLENSHHIKLIANHYTGIVYLPMLLKKMGDIIKSQVPPEIDKPSPALSVDR